MLKLACGEETSGVYVSDWLPKFRNVVISVDSAEHLGCVPAKYIELWQELRNRSMKTDTSLFQSWPVSWKSHLENTKVFDSGSEHGTECCKIYALAADCTHKQNYISTGPVGKTPENHSSPLRFRAGNNT
jgi:hypothetical protein